MGNEHEKDGLLWLFLAELFGMCFVLVCVSDDVCNMYGLLRLSTHVQSNASNSASLAL